ncbi:L-asparaginase [Engraulis encrasicolus]|uniref:L-asparaginase n=1 Tax=Engraulis encrasicolus TaxID=184585 RepID=UPI002FD57A96
MEIEGNVIIPDLENGESSDEEQEEVSQDLEKVKSLKMKPLIIAGPTVRPREFLNTFGDVLDLFWLKARDLQSRRGVIIELLPHFACGAIENNDLFSLQEIVGKMDVNGGDYDDVKAMHKAVETGNIDMVKYLMKKGSSWQLQNRFAENPLLIAIQKRHYSLIKLLVLNKGALRMAPVRTAMLIQKAVAKRDFSLLYAWSLSGYDMDLKDYNGRTAMHVAVRMRDKQLVQILLDYGATPLERDVWNQTPLDEARRNNLEAILALFHPQFTVQFPNKQAYLQHKQLES